MGGLFLLNQRDELNGLSGQGRRRVESQRVETCEFFTTHYRDRDSGDMVSEHQPQSHLPSRLTDGSKGMA